MNIDEIKGPKYNEETKKAIYNLNKFKSGSDDNIYYYFELMRFATSVGSKPIRDIITKVHEINAYPKYFFEELFTMDLTGKNARNIFNAGKDIVDTFNSYKPDVKIFTDQNIMTTGEVFTFSTNKAFKFIYDKFYLSDKPKFVA